MSPTLKPFYMKIRHLKVRSKNGRFFNTFFAALSSNENSMSDGKYAASILSLTELFNHCKDIVELPKEWKFGIITLRFVIKGKKTSIDIVESLFFHLFRKFLKKS